MGSGYYTKKGCVVVFFYQVLLFWLEGYRIYNMSYTHCGSVWVGSRAQMKNQTESLNLGKNKSNKSEKNLVISLDQTHLLWDRNQVLLCFSCLV